MKPKKTAIDKPWLDRGLAPTKFRPRVVFSRDDALEHTQGHGRLPRVLIVEDDYLIGTQMGEALAEAGFELVGIAQSVEEALELAAKTQPLLVIMDIRLRSKRDGIDAAIELYTKHGIRSVFATAHQSDEMRSRAKRANPLAWLPKPFTMMSLVEVVQQAMREVKRDS